MCQYLGRQTKPAYFETFWPISGLGAYFSKLIFALKPALKGILGSLGYRKILQQEPMGLQESKGCSLAFLVLKNNGINARVVTDFKAINRCIKRPNHPTDSSNQLFRQLKSSSKYFATLDCTSEIGIDNSS